MEKLEKFNIITQQQNPLLKRRETKINQLARPAASTASRPPVYPGTVQQNINK